MAQPKPHCPRCNEIIRTGEMVPSKDKKDEQGQPEIALKFRTLVLLAAECSDRFRAVFSFGPADDVGGYGPEYLPFDTSNQREIELRSPGRWLHSIRAPVFVFEGTVQGNLGSLQTMARASTNPKAQFLPVRGATHFSLLAPTTRLIADKILRDTGAESNLAFTEEEVSRPFAR